MKDILLAKSFQRKSACFWRAFNKSQHVCVCVSPLKTINCLFPSIVKTMLFVTKIHKYNLFWESLEGFYCGRRKPANPCHPIDWFCRVFGEFDSLLPWTLNFFLFLAQWNGQWFLSRLVIGWSRLVVVVTVVVMVTSEVCAHIKCPASTIVIPPPVCSIGFVASNISFS